MSKESEYRSRMIALGIWDEAFAGAVHDLCMLERDQAKVRTAWRAKLRAGEDASDLADLLLAQDKSIQAQRDALGLTPKAMKRISPAFGAARPAELPTALETPVTVLDEIRKRRRA